MLDLNVCLCGGCFMCAPSINDFDMASNVNVVKRNYAYNCNIRIKYTVDLLEMHMERKYGYFKDVILQNEWPGSWCLRLRDSSLSSLVRAVSINCCYSLVPRCRSQYM